MADIQQKTTSPVVERRQKVEVLLMTPSSARNLSSSNEDPENDDLPWPIEELTLAETWWVVLQPTVNVTQVGNLTWNKVPTRSQ